ncbi:MAG: hypothetical protein E5Y74_08895 [Mesorhizobium sp.]|uniref:hypothetical protein n=1 Tax=Mesorhizobium sp. TaxID=1871066 RepID=UPI000FE5073B|nr:hypothetical protein [Mesorhizobium sp.]RWP90065.1 MAG: hypothetical protein EOR11_07770 [Mesorhizobium sp.]TIM22690.1 MAG: hypothetical protein E5Y74_08895 [Mesorhizobium sp.]TIN67541.1 MAG: hypothetical protein E5Y30_27360 [Mesorhizobium sp.]
MAGEIVGDAALLAGTTPVLNWSTRPKTLHLHLLYEKLHLGSRPELVWVWRMAWASPPRNGPSSDIRAGIDMRPARPESRAMACQ